MGEWTKVTDNAAFDKALSLAEGTYQRDLILGRESWSGSTLTSAARKYGGRYANSRAHLLARLKDNGVPCGVERVEHGRRVLVIGYVPKVETAKGVELADWNYEAALDIPKIHRLPNYRWVLLHFTPEGQAVILSTRTAEKRRVAVVDTDAGVVRHKAVGLNVTDQQLLEKLREQPGFSMVPVTPEWVASFQRAVIEKRTRGLTAQGGA